ncbi:MAG: glycosyltransferase [Acidimicrobiia bacterium]|nr:glycosyltransferase [Acidimicrobiia bacterium]
MPPAILHVATRYLRGGSERRISDAVDALDQYDHDVVVGSDSDVDLLIALVGPRRVFQIPTLVRPIRPHKDLITVSRLRRLISRGAYAAVFTHQSKGGMLGRMATGLVPGVPVVHSLSSASFGPGYSGAMSTVQASLEKWMDRFTDAYTAVGSDLAERFVSNGVSREKITVIRSGALPQDPTMPDPRGRLVATYDLDPHRPILALVGTIDDRKNIMALPQVLALVATDYQVLVVGDGYRRADLEREMANWDVTFTGHVRNAVDYIAGADRLLLLSRTEGLPQVLAQSGAVGTEFVSYPVDGSTELRELGARGRIAPLDDLDALARCLDIPVDRRSHEPAVMENSDPVLFDSSSWDPEEIRKGYQRLAGWVGL